MIFYFLARGGGFALVGAAAGWLAAKTKFIDTTEVTAATWGAGIGFLLGVGLGVITY
jgi:hypothetical protein